MMDNVTAVSQLYSDAVAALDGSKRVLQELEALEFHACPTCSQATTKCPECGVLIAGTSIMYAIVQGRRELPLVCFKCRSSAKENANG